MVNLAPQKRRQQVFYTASAHNFLKATSLCNQNRMEQSQHYENQRLDIKIKMLEWQYRVDGEGGGHRRMQIWIWATELAEG